MSDPESNAAVNLPELPIRYQAFEILRQSGLNQSEASKALGVTNGRGCQIEKKLKSRDDLTSSKMVKLAGKAHRMILGHFTDPSHNPLKSQIDIKGSDVTKAIDRTYDRVQPVKRSDDRPSSITFIQVNLDGCK